jgi:outer membrane receptor for ferrienterochelin and colicins
MRLSVFLLATVSAVALAPAMAYAADDADPGPKTVREIVVTAQRLDTARQTIQPDLGATTTTLTSQAIDSLPGGDNTALNQVILQMPGVVQDGFGQLHVRDDHANLQYRINGVIIPEGLSVFGQALSPRLAQSVKLITGALPAQYGLRTAGIVDITTKSGFTNGGQVSVYGGSHNTIEPSLEVSGASGSNSFFASASYLQNNLGIESVDGSANPLHDRTTQYQLFGYFDHIIDPSSRISLIAGVSDEKFQIPNPSGLTAAVDGAGLKINGQSDFASESLNQNQQEVTDYAIVSYLKTTDRFTGQLSLFGRYSKLDYMPDIQGELMFNEIAQTALKKDTAFGVQAEGAYRLSDSHTVRGGIIAQTDRSTSDTVTQVLNTPENAFPANNVPISIVDNTAKSAQSFSVYLQDEWKLTEQFTLNYGVRFDQVNAYRNESQVSPRINFVWTPATGTTIYGGYARYFTPPPFELVASTTISKFVGTSGEAPGTVNTTPFSETDDYFDLGVQQKLGRLTLGVDGYWRKAKNLIDEGQFGAPIILTPFNYKDGRIHGVEFSAHYEDGPFTAYGNFAIAKAEGRDIVSSEFNFDPGDLAYISTHFIHVDHDQTYTASAGAAYRFGNTRLSTDLLYGSGLRKDGAVPNGDHVPGYIQVNAAIRQHVDNLFGQGGLDLRFDVINLFDEKYEIRDGSGVGVGAPQWGPRRGFFVGVSKSF